MRPMSGRDRLAEGVLFLLAAVFAIAGFGFDGDEGSGYAPAERQPDSLRVVTWNVGGSSEGGRPLSEEALPAVAATLHQLDPDLVFLQEIATSEQLERLAGRIGLEGLHSRISQGGDNRLLGVLARGGRLRSRQWPGDPRTMAVFYRPEGKRPLIAVALHADAFSARQRNLSIGRAVELLHSSSRQLPRILAGDLNLDLDLGKRGDLFTDDEHLDVESYNYVTQKLFDVAAGSGSTAEPDRRLDYIFASPEDFEVLSAGPWKGRRAADMDHDPLVADLRYR